MERGPERRAASTFFSDILQRVCAKFSFSVRFLKPVFSAWAADGGDWMGVEWWMIKKKV